MHTTSRRPQDPQDPQRGEMDLDEALALDAVVHGNVQGVGFRYWTARRAEELGLVGHAGNNSDGTVSVRVEGPRRAVRELLQTLSSSDTPGAVITVDSHFGPVTGQFTDFTIH